MSRPVADERPRAPLPRALVAFLALACGLAVSSVYYAQPLLDAIAASFGVGEGSIGSVVTAAQLGYALGLVAIVPLGDMLEPRRLILVLLAASAAALVAVALAPTSAALLAAMFLLGLPAVVVQVIVAFAATLAPPAERGAVVGSVTSGVVVGILLARTFAGAITQLFGWEAVYLTSAALTLVVVAVLVRVLPRRAGGGAAKSYVGLIRSTFALYREHPLLRLRAALALLAFGAFSVLWTSLVLPLSAPPLSLSNAAIGAFGLVGAAGAIAASRAGRLVDAGRERWATGGALVLMLLAWLPIALLEHSLWALGLGLVMIDLGLQALHVSSQTLLYALDPRARSRLVAAYMLFYSLGSAAGAIASTATYAAAGWLGVCALGTGLSFSALVLWRRSQNSDEIPTRESPARHSGGMHANSALKMRPKSDLSAGNT